MNPTPTTNAEREALPDCFDRGCNGCDECTDYLDGDDADECPRCHGDGCDPMVDYLLPCPLCQGEQTP